MPLVDGLVSRGFALVLLTRFSHHLVVQFLLEILLIFIRYTNDLFFLLCEIVV